MAIDIPTLSLIVAALAVFVGPMISWSIAKRQIRSSLAVSNKEIIAPCARLGSTSCGSYWRRWQAKSLHYYVAGFEDRTDDEYQRVVLLEQNIKLMLPE